MTGQERGGLAEAISGSLDCGLGGGRVIGSLYSIVTMNWHWREGRAEPSPVGQAVRLSSLVEGWKLPPAEILRS